MEFSLVNIFLAVGAGLASVASPCVLPVVPIIVTGKVTDHRHRPLLIVIGLTITFILMGVITSIFGSFIAGKMLVVERIAGAFILLMGILILMDINVFKKLTAFNNIQSSSDGRWSGLLLGLTLGLIWIPCIGPMLSGILATVATEGHVVTGIIYLLFYSIGFAIPMLLVGYFSQFSIKKIRKLQEHPLAVRIVSGSILLLFGAYILLNGVMGFGW